MIDLQGLSNSARELCERTGMMIVLQNAMGETVFETQGNASVSGRLTEVSLSQGVQGFTLYVKTPEDLSADPSVLALLALRFEPFLKPNQETEIFRNMMCGMMPPELFQRWLALAGMAQQMVYRVYILNFPAGQAEEVRYIAENVLELNKGDLLVEMDRGSLVMVKSVAEDDSADAAEALAEALLQSMTAEAGIAHPVVAVSGVYGELAQLHKAFASANSVLSVGKKCAPAKQAYVFEALRMELFLSTLPRESLKAFYDRYATETIREAWGDKLLATVQCLFDNNLNLSETARQLFLHRNTLVYRLDKIKKLSGLDLRIFDDAVLFKLLMTIDNIL